MRAAQYVRMSTEHQQYSIANQIAAIAEYARSHGFEVVRTYSDEGKSGIDLAHRAGLRQLLDDVIGHSADFRAVLVYDVSRWGRFQDTDESAHYEFLCKQVGIQVHYCAEQFTNDGSILASLFKAIKRTMAGEYLRELSVKTFAGQRRLTQQGYKMGGKPGYGLRRMLISADGSPERELQPREWKYLTTQRVVMVPGPQHETEVVRSIYAMYLDQDMEIMEIVRSLNRREVPRDNRHGWTREHVAKILGDPKYAGCAVFARTSKKFRSSPKVLPRTQWIIQPNSFAPIIPLEVFARAEMKRRRSVRFQSDEQLLEMLRAYFRRTGRIAGEDMRPHNGLPSYQTYKKRFGSLWAAYRLAGILPSQPHEWREESARSRALCNCLADEFRAAMIASKCTFQLRGRLYAIPGCRRFFFQMGRCEHNGKGDLRWCICNLSRGQVRGCAVARLRPDNSGVQDWFLLEQLPNSVLHFSLKNPEIEATRSVRGSAAELITLLIQRLRLP